MSKETAEKNKPVFCNGQLMTGGFPPASLAYRKLQPLSRHLFADNPASVDATITCDNDGASDDGTLTNGPIDSGDWVSLNIGTVTGTQLTVTVTYTVDAQ